MNTKDKVSSKPRFESEHQAFSAELRRRVQTYFKDRSRGDESGGRATHADFPALLKAGILLGGFAGIYAVLVFSKLRLYELVLLTFLGGVVVDLIGLNVLHECAHGNYFKSVGLNRASGYLMDLFGISVDIYRVKHVEVHHRYTNIHRWDGDLDEAYPLVRLTDRMPRLGFHRFQHVYAWFLYSLVTFSWVTSDDLRRLRSMRVGEFVMPEFSVFQKVRIVGAKIFHLAWAIGIPCLYHPFWDVMAVYVGMHLVMGFGITVIFQLAHVFDRSKFMSGRSASSEISYDNLGDWMIHQLQTTSDFATSNGLACFLLGGLNYQVEHHLFPGVSYVHLRAIQKIVKSTCQEFGVPYHEYSGFLSALTSHILMLRTLGQAESGSGG